MLRRTLFLSALLAVVTDAETGPCEPITLPQCQDLPYNTTLLSDGPLGSSQTEAGSDIDARTSSIHDTNCSRVVTLVACAAYLPPCHSVAVSADICRQAQTDCHPVLVQLGIAWPELLSCETSPTDQSTNVSVLRTKRTTRRVRRPKKRTRGAGSIVDEIPECKCKKQRIKRKQYYKKNFSYVIKATFKSGEGIAGGPFILTIHVDEVLKRGKVPISETDLTLWTERDCICPRFKVGRTYLILGYEDSTNKRILFDSRSVALRWRKIWARKIRRWESRRPKNRGPRRHTGKNKKKLRNRKHTQRRPSGRRARILQHRLPMSTS